MAVDKISSKKQGSDDENIYNDFFAPQNNTGISFYDSYFHSDPAKRVLPMEARLLDASVSVLLQERHNDINVDRSEITILDHGAGNGRLLPYYFDLSSRLANGTFLRGKEQSAPIRVSLLLQDISWTGLKRCEALVKDKGFVLCEESEKEVAGKGFRGALYQSGSMSVRCVYSHTEDSFSQTRSLIGPFDLVHSMYGVLSSICDNALLEKTSAMLADACRGVALFVVASEGRFPKLLQKYDALRNASQAGSSFVEPGTISYDSLHQTKDGRSVDIGRERYKVFSFEQLERLVVGTGWDLVAPVVVNSRPPTELSRDWKQACEDVAVCEEANLRLQSLCDKAGLLERKAHYSKRFMHIGAILRPVGG